MFVMIHTGAANGFESIILWWLWLQQQQQHMTHTNDNYLATERRQNNEESW